MKIAIHATLIVCKIAVRENHHFHPNAALLLLLSLLAYQLRISIRFLFHPMITRTQLYNNVPVAASMDSVRMETALAMVPTLVLHVPTVCSYNKNNYSFVN